MLGLKPVKGVEVDVRESESLDDGLMFCFVEKLNSAFLFVLTICFVKALFLTDFTHSFWLA